MKSNLPVSGQEKPYPKGQAVVSKTDLKGIITYANDAFIQLSGYTQGELLGKNHNIVRHPDMPPEAFADLWQTVKKSKPWSGLVKNRCKNGDHYWVDAMVVPIRENNQTVGFMSVRKEPTRDQVASAESLYKRIREKNAVLPKAALSIQDVSIKTRFGLYTVLMLILLVVTGLLGMRSMSMSNTALYHSQKSGLEPAIALSKIQLLMSENRTQITLALQHAPGNPDAKLHSHPLSLHTDVIPRNAEQINSLWREIEKMNLSGETKSLADEFIKTRAEYIKQGIFPARQALLDADFSRASSLLLNKIIPFYEAANGSGRKLFDNFEENATQNYIAESQSYSFQRVLMIFTIVCGVLLGIVATRMLANSIIRPLRKTIKNFDRLAQGYFDCDSEIGRGDEVGAVMAAFAATQVQIRVIIDEIRLAANEVQSRCADLEQEIMLISSNSQSQQDGVLQVSAAMQELSVSVSEVAISAGNASDAAKISLATVTDGRSQMSRCLESTARVVSAVQGSSETIYSLSQSVNRIGDITQVIQDIAEQTNLLALNAAIEAARAGEQGRGFAVVADEVRKLSERTATSTADIAKMVNEINSTTQSAVKSMEKAVLEVESGRGMLQATNDKFQQVNVSSQQVTGMAGQIANAAGEQSSSSQEVSNNMEKMSVLIEKNTFTIEKFKQSIQDLSVTAGALQMVVAHFNGTA